MKYTISAILLISILILSSWTKNQPVIINDYEIISTVDTFDTKAAISEILESIKGRENEAADSVFKNIEIMKGFPAGRLTAIMEMAFNNSLGVNCTHCHNPDDWASDEKEEKNIAREMWKMTGKINSELLNNIADLKGQPPIVNCTTCHRGEIKPALNISK
ncbi:MAG: c-type cytochrome [Bacteroidia bacterium]|nr:c-type cytochrome [Bacteroidia bacterium]